MDLDHFKTLNDTQGHAVGDKLLVEFGRRLKDCVREIDTVSRLGGDEFVVLLEGLGEDETAAATQAELVAMKIHASINQPFMLNGLASGYHTGASIGVTLFKGQETSVETLFMQADLAMYQAKDAGRNGIRFFNPGMQAAIESHARLEADLRRGLEQKELHLHFQPQVDRDGRWIGAEALLRWFPPGGEPVPPSQFIPLAEETGLILPMGHWVLQTACRQLKTWEKDPRTQALSLAVNVSARQFHQPGFVESVAQVLAETGADPARLKLELTESAVLDDVHQAIARMARLKDLGISLSLDDFGTGYSSLSYLKRLPVEEVKIDRSFVDDLPQDPNDAAIVRAILAMSASLGLAVVAEGVENDRQYAYLLQHGCRRFQGYFFGKPMPAEELAQRLEAEHPPGD
jgi:diguanylate cyclase (GGDEF)-like protein